MNKISSKKTIVLGASTNPNRYSFLAVNKLLAHQHEVIAVGNKKGTIGSVAINTEMPLIAGVDTITLYLNPTNQKPYYDYILAQKPKRIIFNPGTENEELESLAQNAGITTIEACTLVLLSIGQY
ncbi:MAG: CoA-binding protein [Phycisphaerales bacterium]|nr:CoA-binding protein [Phycisphaerales bacterium]